MSALDSLTVFILALAAAELHHHARRRYQHWRGKRLMAPVYAAMWRTAPERAARNRAAFSESHRSHPQAAGADPDRGSAR